MVRSIKASRDDPNDDKRLNKTEKRKKGERIEEIDRKNNADSGGEL